MKKLYKFYVLCIFILLNITACVMDSEQSQSNIYDTWALEKIVYDDESVNALEKGNFVEIQKDFILEIIKGHGKRRYSYTQQNEMLSLTSGHDVITWEIIKLEDQKLQIKTPIGLYVLTRKSPVTE